MIHGVLEASLWKKFGEWISGVETECATVRRLFAAAAAAAESLLCHQAPPSLGFSRQEHWSGLPLVQSKNGGVRCSRQSGKR